MVELVKHLRYRTLSQRVQHILTLLGLVAAQAPPELLQLGRAHLLLLEEDRYQSAAPASASPVEAVVEEALRSPLLERSDRPSAVVQEPPLEETLVRPAQLRVQEVVGVQEVQGVRHHLATGGPV